MFRRPIRVALAALIVSLAAGCTSSTVEGPQLKLVPADFGLDREAVARRTVFPGRPMLQRRGYFLRGDEGTASILLTEYEGRVSKSDIELLRAERADAWARSGVAFSELDDIEIDRRDAWSWFERAERTKRFVAIVPYDDPDRTWTVDFYSSVRRFSDDEVMVKHVASFALDPSSDEREPVLFGFFVFFAVIGFIGWSLNRRRKYRRSGRSSFSSRNSGRQASASGRRGA